MIHVLFHVYDSATYTRPTWPTGSCYTIQETQNCSYACRSLAGDMNEAAAWQQVSSLFHLPLCFRDSVALHQPTIDWKILSTPARSTRVRVQPIERKTEVRHGKDNSFAFCHKEVFASSSDRTPRESRRGNLEAIARIAGSLYVRRTVKSCPRTIDLASPDG